VQKFNTIITSVTNFLNTMDFNFNPVCLDVKKKALVARISEGGGIIYNLPKNVTINKETTKNIFFNPQVLLKIKNHLSDYQTEVKLFDSIEISNKKYNFVVENLHDNGFVYPQNISKYELKGEISLNSLLEKLENVAEMTSKDVTKKRLQNVCIGNKGIIGTNSFILAHNNVNIFKQTDVEYQFLLHNTFVINLIKVLTPYRNNNLKVQISYDKSNNMFCVKNKYFEIWELTQGNDFINWESITRENGNLLFFNRKRLLKNVTDINALSNKDTFLIILDSLDGKNMYLRTNDFDNSKLKSKIKIGLSKYKINQIGLSGHFLELILKKLKSNEVVFDFIQNDEVIRVYPKLNSSIKTNYYIMPMDLD